MNEMEIFILVSSFSILVIQGMYVGDTHTPNALKNFFFFLKKRFAMCIKKDRVYLKIIFTIQNQKLIIINVINQTFFIFLIYIINFGG